MGNIKLFNYPIKFNQVHYMRVFKSKYFRATFMVSAEITWKGAVKNGKQKIVYAKVTDATSHLLGCTNCIRLNKHGLLSEAIRAERRKKHFDLMAELLRFIVFQIDWVWEKLAHFQV